MSMNVNNKLQKTTKYYGRVREYRKVELDNISKWLGVFVYSSKKSRIWKSKLANEYRY